MTSSKANAAGNKAAKRPSVLTMPYEEWPARDRSAFEAATRVGDALDPGGPAEDWSDATRQSNIARYSRWLRFLECAGLLDRNQAPADRVTPDAVRAYIAQFQAEVDAKRLSSETLHAYVRGLLNCIMKMAPKQNSDWAWLRTAAENLRKIARPSRDKRLQTRSTSDLYAYGKELMQEAEDPATGTSRRRAVRYRDGVIIAILAARAPRRGCLSLMDIEGQFQKIGELYWMIFSAEETKQRRDHDYPLPRDLTPYVDRYLGHHRMVLASRAKGLPDDESVWLTENGTKLGAPAISHQVRVRTKAKFNVEITPHLFRDCLADTTAHELPGNLGIAAQILGHGLEVMNRHYIRPKSRVALRRVHDNLAASRRELAPLNTPELWAAAEPRGRRRSRV